MSDSSLQLRVVSAEALDDLRVTIHERLGAYRASGNVPVADSQTLPTPYVVSNPPTLVITNRKRPADNDVENAIALHRWLSGVFASARDARDNRLWTWLAHDVFADYCRARWPIPTDDKKALNSVRDHWFLLGQGRGSVGRHALARLWWAAEATFEPRRVDPLFEQSADADPYFFTRLLLGTQNAHLQIRDRSFGSSRRVLLAALESLRHFRDRSGSIDKGAAWLGRELNIVSRYRDLDGLASTTLVSLCDSLLSLPGAPPRTAEGSVVSPPG